MKNTELLLIAAAGIALYFMLQKKGKADTTLPPGVSTTPELQNGGYVRGPYANRVKYKTA